MKICPNRHCSFLETYGEVAEYRDEITHCVDCGTPLVDRSQALVLLPIHGDESREEGEEEEDDMEMDGKALVVIATFDHPTQAHISRAHLEAEGIPAFLFDEHTMTNNWLMTSALGGVRLAVPESAVAAAKAILADADLATGVQGDEEEAELLDTEHIEEAQPEGEHPKEEIDQPMQSLHCLRCQGEMKLLKQYKFESQDNNRGLFSTLFDIEERLIFDLYVCTACRHTEFFFTGSSKKWGG